MESLDVFFTIIAAALVLMCLVFAVKLNDPLSEYRGSVRASVGLVFLYAGIATGGSVTIVDTLQRARDYPYTVHTVTATVEVKVLKERP